MSSRIFQNGYRGPLYNRSLNKERGTFRDYRRRSLTPVRRERMWDSCSRSPSPQMNNYPRHRNRDGYMPDRSRSPKLSRDYIDTPTRYDRDRSRSPKLSRDYIDTPTRYDRSPIYERFNSFDWETSGGFPECTSHREESHFMMREPFIDGQRRNYKIKNRGNHSSESKYFSRSLKIPHHPLLICKFYNNEGTCKNGNTCVYLHVCKYYINDDCKFGTRCMRSHNVLDEQPRSILERYDMVPRYYNKFDKRDVNEITRRVKERLEDQESKGNTFIPAKASAVHLDDNKAAKKRTFDQMSDNVISDEDRQDNIDRKPRRSLSTDSSYEQSLEDTNGPFQTRSKDFIPLEQKVATDTKSVIRKKGKKLESKTKIHRHGGKKIKIEDGETLSKTEDEDSPKRFQSAMTFNRKYKLIK